MPVPRSRPISIRLSPLCGGSYTRLRLCVSVPTPLPLAALRCLCDLLALASGERVQFALSVDVQAGPWCDSWAAVIADLPARHARLRLLRFPRRPAP
jgi:hypothetical protein